MKSLKILSLLSFSLIAPLASAQFGGGGQMNMNGQFQGQAQGQQGYAMPGGTYQPAMQPGAYQTAQVQGAGEHAAYQNNSSQPCSPRGGYSSIEGPIANGAAVPQSGAGGSHN